MTCSAGRYHNGSVGGMTLADHLWLCTAACARHIIEEPGLFPPGPPKRPGDDTGSPIRTYANQKAQMRARPA